MRNALCTAQEIVQQSGARLDFVLKYALEKEEDKNDPADDMVSLVRTLCMCVCVCVCVLQWDQSTNRWLQEGGKFLGGERSPGEHQQLRCEFRCT